MAVFPYEFTAKYHPAEVTIHCDKKAGMLYVFHNGKRMYFPKGYSPVAAQKYYVGLLMQQDAQSPHRYASENFTVDDGDIIADLGAAEGIWALSYAEKVAKIYLFECDDKWMRALEKTFEPYKEKTVIVHKYISDVTKGNNITLDDFLEAYTPVCMGGE
jgi:16S rRNA C967 or C1407 C5-methylase (RsmB/RsmF family)